MTLARFPGQRVKVWDEAAGYRIRATVRLVDEPSIWLRFDDGRDLEFDVDEVQPARLEEVLPIIPT